MSALERNVAMLVAYDGRPFHGWQRHPGRPTVQGTIEAALSEVLGGERLIEGSGRTDRGVHADGQVATTRIPADTDLQALGEALHARLAPDVHLHAIEDVPDGVHARTSATAKTYRYEIFQGAALPAELELRVWHVKRPLAWEPMAEAARHLVGTHDFATFAANAGFDRGSTVRTMHAARVAAEGPRITVWLEADGFLYKMVRTVLRALARVGEGRARPNDVAHALAARDRAASPGAAPASGLYLESVRYDPPLFAEE